MAPLELDVVELMAKHTAALLDGLWLDDSGIGKP
jgi:hypothetical protein